MFLSSCLTQGTHAWLYIDLVQNPAPLTSSHDYLKLKNTFPALTQLLAQQVLNIFGGLLYTALGGPSG